jgi:hypothetical protein
MSRWVMAFLVGIVHITCAGQERSLEQMLEDQAILGDIRENEEDPQQLQQFRKQPLDLNGAGRDDLSLFPFLTGQHIEQFMLYRRMLGPLHHILELQAVPGWDADLVRRILPYVMVRESTRMDDLMQEARDKAKQQLLFRSASGRSPGFMVRYRFQSPVFLGGLSVEKDRGEELFHPGKGIAFLSAHAVMKGKGLLRNLTVGDYLVNMGQGLLLWQGRGFRKSGATVMVKRQLPVFQEYRSNDENRFMRGLAMTLGKKAWSVSLFLSRNLQDANVRLDSFGHKTVTSLLYSGLHRTQAELADKNALVITSLGASAQYTTPKLRMALNGASHTFSIPLERGDLPYQRYAMAGSVLRGGSVSYQYTWRSMHWFGELSYSGGPGSLHGVMIAADKKLDLAILARSIDVRHRSFGSSAFTESAMVNNEDGIYAGIHWRPSGSLNLEAYTDHFRSAWLRYRLNRPSFGHDHLVQISWQPAKTARLVLRWKREVKMENLSGTAAIQETGSGVRENLRLHVEHKLSRQVEWRSRLEWVWRDQPGLPRQTGFAWFTDLFFRSPVWPVHGNMRLMIYDTDSYEARIYAYENDVMYYSQVASHFGRGALVYWNTRYQATDKLELFLRYSSQWSKGLRSAFFRFQLIYQW